MKQETKLNIMLSIAWITGLTMIIDYIYILCHLDQVIAQPHPYLTIFGGITVIGLIILRFTDRQIKK
jgi:hypothetical protein